MNRANKEFVIAYRGTEWYSIKDLATDINAILGGNSIPEQYWEGAILAFNTRVAFHNDNVNYKIILVGHSLGGGIAQLSAGALGLKAYAFNALPMSNYMYDLMLNTKDYIKNDIPELYNPRLNINHLISEGNIFYDTVASIPGKIYGSNIKSIRIYIGLKHGLVAMIKYLKKTSKAESSESVLDKVWSFFGF